MTNHYLPETSYQALLSDLAAAFTQAANSTSYTLRDLLVLALVQADVMPEECREDEADVVLSAA